MKTFYFVGGPRPGDIQKFHRRLATVGGPPEGWQVYPHADGSGLALHMVATDNVDTIAEHLQHFAGIYQAGAVIEVVAL
jgi:hypothetical protein